MSAKEICQRCGSLYEGTSRSWYCEKCRREAARKSAKERNLHQLGLEARQRYKAEVEAALKGESNNV